MRTSIVTTTVLVIALGGLASGHAAHAGNACRATAKAANQACRNEATDEFWIATGNCLNLSTLEATKACKKTAKQGLTEHKGDCGAQLDARNALCGSLGKGPYDPAIDPATFASPADVAAHPNPYFPLVPGTVSVFAGGGEIDTVTVTDETKVLDGVTTIVVRDIVTDTNHVVTEDTRDYYAQQTDGTVWYFGEDAQQLENGEIVGLEGSFRAGVANAKPGIIMKAAPMVGDVYRQEFALGDAEDAGEVINTAGSESVPGATCTGTCVVTHDFSPLEPDADEQKFYAPGVGVILEVDVAEGGTRLELVSVTHN
jgi:hypothetical protein